MDSIQKLKAKLVKLNFSEKVSIKDTMDTKLYKKQIVEDGKKVRATFKDEDLQPRLNTI